MRWTLPRMGYDDEEAQRGFQRNLLSRVSQIPGVRAAGLLTPLPLEMGSVPSSWTLAPGAGSSGSAPVMAHMRTASPGYLEAMGLRLIAGTRLLSSQIYGVDPLDPLAFAVPIVGLALLGVLACRLPARRAREADPVRLLKSD